MFQSQVLPVHAAAKVSEISEIYLDTLLYYVLILGEDSCLLARFEIQIYFFLNQQRFGRIIVL